MYLIMYAEIFQRNCQSGFNECHSEWQETQDTDLNFALLWNRTETCYQNHCWRFERVNPAVHQHFLNIWEDKAIFLHEQLLASNTYPRLGSKKTTSFVCVCVCVFWFWFVFSKPADYHRLLHVAYMWITETENRKAVLKTNNKNQQ